MKPYFENDSMRIFQGDCREVLRSLEAESVQCCVTSPPYWGLRDYGTASWDGGDIECDHRVGRFERGGLSEKQASNNGSAGDEAQSTCPKCGAIRKDSQLGLERTPDEYIANMVGVFREVKRVLRSDGTLWLNMGDSYAGSWGNYSGENRGSGKQREIVNGSAAPNPAWDGLTEYRPAASRPQNGLKPKDLCGIPWLLAMALRAPYYTGTIKRVEDRIWLAAMIDAEGCMFIHKRKAGQNNGQGYQRQNDSFSPGLEVANTCEAVVLRCQQVAGLGSICTQGPEENGRRKQKLYRWNLRTTECRDIIREIYPHLVAKHQQARILIGCPSSGDKAVAAHAALMGLHNGIATDVDGPEPVSMYEPGWYLRSDIIWKKPNPMPESVTDRPTKAHEYIFLLSKSERYFYDAEAIREAWSCDRDDMREKGVRTGLGYLQQGPVARNHTPGVNSRIYQDRDPQHSAERKTIKVPGGWDRGEGAHGTIHRDGRTEAEYQEADVKSGRNKRSVWTVATSPFPEAHFATFPPDLIKPCILAGCPAGGTVLDPFYGAGTTGLVARAHNCKVIGIELSGEYLAIAAKRLSQEVFAW